MVFAKRDSQWLSGLAAYHADEHCYELNIEQLARLPLLVREAGSGTRQIIDEQLLKHLPHAEVVRAIQQSEAIKHMVSADIGLGCLSQHVIEIELAAGKVVTSKIGRVLICHGHGGWCGIKPAIKAPFGRRLLIF